MTSSDLRFIKKLLRAIIDAGYFVSVHNGENYEEFEKHHVRNDMVSNDLDSIVKELDATGEDWLYVLEDDEKFIGTRGFRKIGHYFLIYSNGFGPDDCEGVVADYSDNAILNGLYNSVVVDCHV